MSQSKHLLRQTHGAVRNAARISEPLGTRLVRLNPPCGLCIRAIRPRGPFGFCRFSKTSRQSKALDRGDRRSGETAVWHSGPVRGTRQSSRRRSDQESARLKCAATPFVCVVAHLRFQAESKLLPDVPGQPGINIYTGLQQDPLVFL